MIGKKKVIGLCAAKIHSAALTEYLSRLYPIALKEGFKLIVFNSPVEPSDDGETDSGAEAVFDLINFDIVDILAVFLPSFGSRRIPDMLVKRAGEAGKQVIMLKEEYPGCRCILDDYDDGFKEIIDHVINEHGVRDTFFIAGRRGEPNSERRIACYKEVLEKNGIEYTNELVDYGDYWAIPAQKALQRFIKKRQKPKPLSPHCT